MSAIATTTPIPVICYHSDISENHPLISKTDMTLTLIQCQGDINLYHHIKVENDGSIIVMLITNKRPSM